MNIKSSIKVLEDTRKYLNTDSDSSVIEAKGKLKALIQILETELESTEE